MLSVELSLSEGKFKYSYSYTCKLNAQSDVDRIEEVNNSDYRHFCYCKSKKSSRQNVDTVTPKANQYQ